MNELIAQLKEKAGLTDDQAIKAIHVLKDFLDGKVPPMFRGVVDKFFAKNEMPREDDPLG